MFDIGVNLWSHKNGPNNLICIHSTSHVTLKRTTLRGLISDFIQANTFYSQG
jgi:hypothetical protein